LRIKIRYKNAQYEIRDRYASYMHIPEYYDYEGIVVDKPKHVKDDSFCLRYGSGRYDFRILKKDSVICGWLYE
jgi:hypothetical protein